MLICIELNKKGYKFTAPLLQCKSNDELQIILNRLSCLKRTIEKFDKDSVDVDENYKLSTVNVEEKQRLEKEDLTKRIEELQKQLNNVHELEKQELEEKHLKDIQDVENLKHSISDEIKKMNEDFVAMNKQNVENISIEVDYQKLCKTDFNDD